MSSTMGIPPSVNELETTPQSNMKFTSFTTVINTAGAMVGAVIVSPANKPTPNEPNVVPSDKPVGCSKGVDACSPAQVTAAPRPGCLTSARITIT
ncbi:hypothetical protein CY34DRAFT_19799 [Suillus luteus UH-Slu-Lm8-n1]|uniref:Uncharacterized protein n=1 Tax=Suillus luteus UH-Slu-Lm8-n1 TaxID=930992 RepID=A0A0D0A081_9AGAM|nr:hypothetical protein CY34DRAFT_19799 [Suillus luteus UH-Slu-Lm8-n1]